MKSLAKNIAHQFFLIIALLVMVLSVTIICLLREDINQHTNDEIKHAIQRILSAEQNGESVYAVEAELPYYIVYTIYNLTTQKIAATNDPFVPILPLTNGRARHYHEKDFYTDGDLNLRYNTQMLNRGSDVYVVQVGISRDEGAVTQTLWFSIARLLVIVMLPLLLVSYLAAFLIAKRTLKPIVRMTKTAATISSNKLDTMLAVSERGDELDSLAMTFNDLFSRIKDDFNAVNAANQAKSAFLSNMSHEIRTPINAVLGLDEMILRESNEDAIKDYARDIQSSGKSLLSIINDILDFSKIEAGKMEIIPVDYDLATVISDLVNMMSTRAAKKGLHFTVTVAPDTPHRLRGDETRIKQCILNILTNAVKYTPQGSVTMTIGTDRAADTASAHGGDSIRLRVTVTDTGIGIKADDLQKLFSPFERIEERRNRSIEGTGLGMSIVKSLLAAMGTQLEVESVYGKGSTFAFSVVQTVRDWEPIGDYAATKSKAERESAAYTESFQAPDARILAVDDTPLNLTVIRGLLKKTRVQIDTAESGSVALNMARKTHYDLLLVDHRMPKMDGIEMLHVLRGDSSSVNQRTVCIALTANAISGAREMYLAAGFEDYLSKPVETAALEAALVRYLPAPLVLHKGDAGFMEQPAASDHAAAPNSAAKSAQTADGASDADAAAIAALWQSLFGQDIKSALHHCGSADVFLEAARGFYDAIDAKAADIARYAAESDWENYTVQVHALKSSARLIGAEALSALAAELERCGDAAKAGGATGSGMMQTVANAATNAAADDASTSTTAPASIAAATIAAKTPTLLALYKSYQRKLAPLFGIAADSSTADARPAMSAQQLDDALSALHEVLTAFDFDSADSIIAELSAHALPAAFTTKFTKLKKAVRDADQAAALALLA